MRIAQAPVVHRALGSWRASLRNSGFEAPMALLVIGALIATIFAAQQREAFRELRTVVLEPLAIYFLLLRHGGRTDSELGRFFDALVIAGAGVALAGIYQYFFTADAVAAEEVRRVRVFYGSPNNVGLFLGRIIPIAICLGLGDHRRRWHLFVLAPLALALALTFSMGAWLGVAAALLFIALMQGRRIALIAAGCLATAAVAVLALAKVERVTSHLSLDQGTNLTRLLLWRSAVDMVRDYPVFGIGPDNFLYLYRNFYQLPEAWREPDLSHPHNLVLDFWLRTGLLGLAAGAWLLLRFFALGAGLYRSARKPFSRALVLGILASTVGALVHGLVDNSLFLVDLALVFWLFCATLELMRRQGYNTGGAP